MRLEKKGIRVLGLAESFRSENSDKSVLAGVVMRRDGIIDGAVFGSATIKGDDATEAMLKMYDKLSRNDINVIMFGGTIISLYNIVDVKDLQRVTGVPSIGVSFNESAGLEESLRMHFAKGWRKKIAAYRRLGNREAINLKTGYEVFVRPVGLTTDAARLVLDAFTLQGSVPEPIRVAKILARSRL